MKSSHYLTLPSSFDPRAVLPWTLRDRYDDARYAVSVVMRKMAHRVVDDLGVVRLKMEYMRDVMEHHSACDVMQALVDGGVLERFPYSPGIRSYGYRLDAKFVADPHVRVPATDRRLIARLDRSYGEREAERQAILKPVHRELEKRQRRLRIDGDKARKTLATLPPEVNAFDNQAIIVRDIEERRFRLSVGEFGRVANAITSMKRELRRHLHVGGKQLGHVDIRCSQFSLLASIMRRHAGDGREAAGREPDKQALMMCNTDYLDYQSVVSDGTFYDAMLAELGGTRLTRDDIKRRAMADVISKRRRYPSPITEAFSRRWPTVWKFIEGVNRHDHASLIRILQQTEADLVIGGVADDLLRRFPGMFVLSLHDAVFAVPDDLSKVERAFRRAFECSGFSMSMKTEL